MRLGNEAKVGLIVFAAFLTLVAVYWFLDDFGLRTSTYPVYAVFANVQKLDSGADVRLAGVKIGVVKSIGLTGARDAKVEMWIRETTKIPKDSRARVTTGAVIGDAYVEIVPGMSSQMVKSGGEIQGEQLVQFDQMMADAGALIAELRKSAQSVNQLLGDKELVGSIKDTIKGLEKSANSASELLASAQGMVNQSSPQVTRVFDNLAVASESAIRISQELESTILQDARPQLQGIMEQAGEATRNLNVAIIQAQEIITKFNSNSGRVSATFDKVDATVDQAQQMMTNLNEASASFKELATDEELKANIRATVCNAAQASAEANALMSGLSQRFSKAKNGPTALQKASIPDYGVSGDALWNMGTGDYRFDGNYTFAGSGNNFYRAGLYNIGENTRVNLMGGMTLDRYHAFRYGLYASRLGIGYDRRFGPGFRVSADLFRPNDPMLELRGIFGVTDSLGVYTGVEDLFGGSDKNVLLGVHYNK